MNTGTKRITEGAMMCALVGLALFLNRQFGGLLEYATYWILSFPILIYTVKYGWKAALIPACAMMALSFMLAMPTTMFYLASALLCGLAYGQGVRSRWSNQWILAVCGGLTIISYFITMVAFAAVFGYDPKEDIMIAEKLVAYLHLGNINIGQLALIFSVVLSVTTAVLQTICVHLFAVMILRRMKLPSPVMKTVFDCRMPKGIAWISICIWLLFSLRNMLKLEGNMLVAVISLYTIVLILLCAECILDLICFTALTRRLVLGLLLAFACIGLLAFSPTRTIIALFGVVSILTEPRQKWKRGVSNGTIRKS